jgi:hypothetical protein
MKRSIELLYDEVITSVAAAIARNGFTRKGSMLRATLVSAVALIEFQRSDKSTAEAIEFTVNLGIALTRLLDGAAAGRPSMRDAHLRIRLGMVTPEKSDKWWRIASTADASIVASNVATSLALSGIPYLFLLSDEANLRQLWESGISPGLTAVQRTRFLEKLRG